MSNSASLHVNVECALVYIPSMVGRAYIWAAVLQKGNRTMRSEVAPYNSIVSVGMPVNSYFKQVPFQQHIKSMTILFML